ncbi:AmmeMemoRadiSam system protein B [Candidatus Pacearchaeota archaeon CG10_big_fil_rev_8_21_14_0_10_35_13]|nr:MAG: AmmeMemoRadiSam system protein B [Candidatus Pacearchaeota archaeon CG10_big_fil_rev_8_21_14_0_10_35_13]
MRSSLVESQYYPSDPDALKERIRNLQYFSKIPFINGKVIGLVVPDSELDFSGRTSSKSFRALADNILSTGEQVKTFVILGVNHSGLGSKISFSVQDFDTSLGVVNNDVSLTERLLTGCLDAGLEVSVSESAHRNDYSVEVQLPFIKTVSPDALIVPVLLKDLSFSEVMKFSEIIYDIFRTDSRTVIISSSSLLHNNLVKSSLTGISSSSISLELSNIDKSLFSELSSLNIDGFFLRTIDSSLIGASCVSSCLESCKLLGASIVEVLEVTNSLACGRGDDSLSSFVSAVIVR